MLRAVQQFPFVKGDELRVYYPDIGLWHNGIVAEVVPSPYGWSSAHVIHNSKRGGGVCVVSLEEFASGNTVQLNNRPLPEYAELVVSRAQRFLGQPYNAFSLNCEHFTTWVLTGVPHSEQLQSIVWVAALGAAAVGLMMVSDSGNERG